MELSGKVALVTGGARMGGAVAQALSNRGCTVVLTWRSSKVAAEKTLAELRLQGGHAAAFHCDLAKEASIRKLVQAISRQFSRLDVLINLASIYERSPLGGMDDMKAWDEHLSSN